MNLRRRVAILLSLYLISAVLTVMPAPWEWRTHIVGESRDALLNLSALDWVSRNLFHWHSLWQGQFFQPHPLTTAYSDVLLPQSLLFAVLRPIVGPAVAFNVIELVAWVVALWACHCLMRRFCPSDTAAFIGSFGWNYSMVRLTQLEHFQFVTAGAFIPLVLLAVLRYVERPSPRRGVELALAFAGITLAANYYGPMMAIAVVIVGVIVGFGRRDLGVRALVAPLAIGALVGAALVVPVWWQYQRLEQDPHFVRAPVARFSTRPSDLAGVSSFSKTLDAAPLLHTSNNPLFPGVAVGMLAAAGVVIAASRRVRRGSELLALLVLASLMLVLSGGDFSWRFGVGWFRPYDWVGTVVPGFAGIRAPARFAILFELGLAAAAVVALDGIRIRSRAVFALIGLMIIAMLIVETRVDVPNVRIPDRHEWTAVNEVLRDLPRGLTVELPVVLEANGGSAIEAPRMVLARRDGQPRVNGYSGYEPPGYDRVASTVNRFPSATAVTWLERHDIRYVIIRTGIVGHLDGADLAFQRRVQPQLDSEAIDRLLTDPPTWVNRARRVGDAILIELRPRPASIGTAYGASP